ncbi:hypothetical protein M407DRAFT_68444 [Tulasnella calospora MUT 4182]|uniref:Aldehyde dehydrogenase domain-containing protein n=1 Tax=Tulasnella calospora MUT 4182 TaxID=1051891 RepID=A0A0C3LB20_9AGAM|nr:hypothetical protein M407DRAFT_68444 [Tulasnella calospora MUT 4182]
MAYQLAAFKVPDIDNEPLRQYAPATAERAGLQAAIAQMKKELPYEVPIVINGKHVKTGKTAKQPIPSDHASHLCTYHEADEATVAEAIKGALAAKAEWEAMSWHDRASIFLKAADLISGKYRYKLMAATILGQGKNAWQAEIDAAAELIDFLRFGVKYVEELYAQQPPKNSAGVWNRVEYRPLEGFVLAVSPFNFTAIGGNLPAAPALVGNTVVWKPSPAATYSNYIIHQILTEAGLPAGVIQFVPGPPPEVVAQCISHSDFAALHFTGSTFVFKKLYIDKAKNAGGEILCGGTADDSVGYFVQPTVILTKDPKSTTMVEEIFGPVLTVYVYDDDKYEETCKLIDTTTAYALTGSIFSADRAALIKASNLLRNAAGNVYLNEKCTGAVVGQQPFGGGRASGTNDKAGSINLFYRFVSPRSVKEGFVGLEDFGYPSNLM